MKLNLFERLHIIFSNKKIINNFLFLFFAIAIIIISKTAYSYSNPNYSTLDLITLILADLIIVLILFIFLIRKILLSVFKDYKSSRIRARIILMFSIIAIIPTIIVSIFSVLILNFAMKNWFNSTISTAINQSVRVADLYIAEHKIQLRDTALSVAGDINGLYFEVIHNPLILNNILNTQAEMRSLTEAIIFQRKTNTIMAQTPMSFALSFWKIPEQSFEKANSGEVVEVLSDPGKIRMLIKLRDYEDTYILLGRLIDEHIIHYVDKTNGAANEYEQIMNKLGSIQIRFALMFVLISGILLIATITVGSIFAGKISHPIRKLVKATELVQAGDFSVQIPTTQAQEDELTILTQAFNRMVRKIDILQKDEALAQRAIAWTDVARRVAHEIKNPLTPITLSADRLSKKYASEVSDPEEFKRYTSTILRHTNDIKKIVTEFAEFARMPTPIFEKIELVSTLKELVESRKVTHENIKYSFSHNIPNLIFPCDITQLNQLLVNLLKNAEEALENLPINKEINVSLILTNEDLEISVTDNGKGFPPNLIDKVTEAYLTTRSKGSGLGLAIVKKIIQDHGGEIIISNSENGGGCVKLIFDRKAFEQNA